MHTTPAFKLNPNIEWKPSDTLGRALVTGLVPLGQGESAAAEKKGLTTKEQGLKTH